MSAVSRKTRDELARRLMDVVLARLDAPVSLTIPELKLEPMEIDEDWTLFKEIHPELFEGKPDPATIKRLKTTTSGTKRITIRVPNWVLQVFRDQAETTVSAQPTHLDRSTEAVAVAGNQIV